MKRIFKWIGIVVLTVMLLIGALAAHTWYAKPLSINWYYTRIFAQFALDNPELLTQLRMLEGLGLRGHNAKLADASPAETERQFAKLKSDYATLTSYDTSHFTGQDKLSYEILEHYLHAQVVGEAFRYHDFPVNQMFGIQSALPNVLTEAQQVNDATDAENYIARLNLFEQKFDQVIESLKLRESRNIVPPRFVVEKVGEQIKTFLAPGAAGNTLVLSFKTKLAKIPADKMDQATRDTFLKRAEESTAVHVMPAYSKLAAYLTSLLAKAQRNDGAWALPDGDKYYQYMVELNTTTTMKAADVHQLGLDEVQRIGMEIDQILDGQGLKPGTRGERIAELSKQPAQLYPDNDVGRAQILKDYQSIIDEITAGLDPYFGIKPKSKVIVERVPVFTEKTAPGAYYNGPAFDGSKPGVFYANLRKLDSLPKFGMHTLAYHEAVPGHHLQIAIAQELKGLPIFRNIIPFTAFSEGWALYAERLAWEAGFEKNPLDNLGRLQAEMFRAVRLVVDTGIHAKRWTREQAIEYMQTNTGMAESEVVAEIERYFVAPGQALGYKVGMLKFLELREKAKKELGAKFDIHDFHDTVLKNGAMPLAVLERVVNEYIAVKKT